jgi:hypothetical protein
MRITRVLIGGAATVFALAGCSGGTGTHTAQTVPPSISNSASPSASSTTSEMGGPTGSTTPSASKTGSATPSSTPKSAVASQAVSLSPPPSASPFGAQIQLNRTSPDGALAVTITSKVTGTVAQLYSKHDQTLIPGTEQTLRTRVTFGDGQGVGGSDGGDVSCRPGTPAVPLSEQATWSYTYSTPGTYVVTFQTWACLPTSTDSTTTDAVQETLVSAVLRVTV